MADSVKRFKLSNLSYPQRFFVRVFPESKNLAVARTMAIWSGWILFAIVIITLAIIFMYRSQKINPIFVYYNNEGNLVLVDDNSKFNKLSWADISMQNQLASFIVSRYEVLEDAEKDSKNWCDGSATGCNKPSFDEEYCNLYCNMSVGLYDDFRKRVLPDYQKMLDLGYEQNVVSNSLFMKRISHQVLDRKKSLFQKMSKTKTSIDVKAKSAWTGSFLIENKNIHTGQVLTRKILFYAELEQEQIGSIKFKISQFNDYLDIGDNTCEIY